MGLIKKLGLLRTKLFGREISYEEVQRLYGLTSEDFPEWLNDCINNEEYNVGFKLDSDFKEIKGWVYTQVRCVSKDKDGIWKPGAKRWVPVKMSYDNVADTILETRVREVFAGKSLSKIEINGDYFDWMKRSYGSIDNEENYNFIDELKYKSVGEVQDKIDEVVGVCSGENGFVSYFPAELLTLKSGEEIRDYLNKPLEYSSVGFTNFDIKRVGRSYEVSGRLVLTSRDGEMHYSLPLKSDLY